MRQNYDGSVRVIVVDDASTDETFSRIPRIGGVEVLRNSHQLGRSGSRNRGLEAVDTDFVAIQDADDVSLPLRLSLTIPLALDQKTIVGAQLVWQDERHGTHPGTGWPSTFDTAELALSAFRTPIAHPSMLIPTHLLKGVGGYDVRFPVAEDLDLMLRLRGAYPEVKFTSSPTQGVIYSRPRFDSLSYNLNASYWRSQVELSHTGIRPRRLVWALDGSERFLRQRIRYLRTRTFSILGSSAGKNA